VSVALDQNLYVLSPYGPVQPTTLAGPVRQGLGKYGDGLFIEEGTTNLYALDPQLPSITPASGGDTAVPSASNPTKYGRGSTKVTTAAGSADLGNHGGIGVTFSGAGTYTVTCDVLASAEFGTLRLDDDSSYAGSSLVSSDTYAAGTYGGKWVRLRRTITVVGGDLVGQFTIRTASNATAGATFCITGVQIESKTYATSFCDGSLATPWNDSRNLYSQSFEDGTTGSWTGTALTVANSTTNPYTGTKCLLLTTGTTANAFASYGNVPVTGGKTYTLSCEMRANINTRSGLVTINYYDAGNTLVLTTNGTAVTSSTSTHLRYTVTATAPATATYAVLIVNPSTTAPASGDTFSVDAVAFAEGTGLAAYRWTGAENASTSTRTASVVTFPAAQAPAFSWGVVLKVGAVPTAATARSVLAANGSGTAPQIYVSNSAVVFTSNVDVAATVAYTPTAGDVLTIVGVLAADAKTYTVYLSVNGAAVTTNTSTASGTAFGSLSSLWVGSNNGNGLQVDGVIEQVLIFNRAITSTEVNALAALTSEVNYATDPGIVLAAATGTVRDTTQAETAAGTGYYRSDRTMKCYVERLTPTGSNPDDDTATVKISVPAGSGIGVGQLVAVNYPQASYGRTVQRVFSPGGDYDELYVA
jgi:hypothetical protein